jgi:hypothetical protein
MPRPWVAAVLAAGVVPAAHVPEASVGRGDVEEFTGADPVEDSELQVRAVGSSPLEPGTVAFLDGIEQWRVVGYSGVTPIVRAYIAAAIRVRGADRRPRTVAEEADEFAITRLEHLTPAARAAILESGVRVTELSPDDAGQPARALPAARVEVEKARAALERRLAERRLATLRGQDWLVVDGVLSDSASLSEHPRALGIVKSHGAQYFAGAELERALTLPAGHRTSVFRPRRRGARRDIYSWYLRLWPWEGNDLLYGLVRVEARAHPDTIALASAVSRWLLRERAPLATPDRRWDRLLYPVHDVETYLRARAPRDLLAPLPSRLPRTGS